MSIYTSDIQIPEKLRIEQKPAYAVALGFTLYLLLFGFFCWTPARAAVLKISSCPTPVSPNVFVCSPGNVSLAATGASGTQIYKWYAQPNGGDTIGTGSPFIFNVTASTTLYVAIADTNCEGSRDAVIITLTSNPPGPSTTNGFTCGPGSVTLTANSTLQNPVFQWFDTPFGGSPVGTGNTFSVNLTSVSDTFFVRAISGTCTTSRTIAIARLRQSPASPQISDTTRCGQGSVTLAPLVPSGTTVRWYADSLTPATPFFTGTVFTTPVFSGNVYYYITAFSGGCESQPRKKVNVFFNFGPPLSGAADVTGCQASVYKLTASTAAGATIQWYDSASGGNLIATGDTLNTPVISQTTSYWVTAKDAGGCETAREEVVVQIVGAPDAPQAGDSSRCGPGLITLSATSSLLNPQFEWFDSPAGGNSVGTGSSLSVNLSTSSDTFYVRVGAGDCISARTQVIARLIEFPAPPQISDTSICGSGILTISPVVPAGSNVRWYTDSLPGPGPFFTGSTYTTPVISEPISYFLTAVTDGCESEPRKRLKISINAGPPVSGASDAARCLPGVFQFTAASVTGATVQWFDSASGGNLLASGDTLNSSFISQTTSFWVSAIDAGGCESPRQEVKALIVTAPEAPLARDSSRCGPGQVLLRSQPVSGFSNFWYADASANTPIFSGPDFTSPSISTTTTYYVSAFIPGCESERRPVLAKINPKPSPLSADTTGTCTSGSLNLLAKTENKVHWYNSPGAGFISSSNPLNINFTGDISYFVSIVDTITGCESDPSPHLAQQYSFALKAEPKAIVEGETSQLSADKGKFFSWEPTESLSNPNIFNPVAKPAGNTIYRVTVTFKTGCTLSDTISVFVTPSNIPNVFTPNGDKIFDTWEIPGALKNKSNKLTVFNRWGTVVLDKSGYENDWDGAELPAGTYYYRYDEGSGKAVSTGTVTIVK